MNENQKSGQIFVAYKGMNIYNDYGFLNSYITDMLDEFYDKDLADYVKNISYVGNFICTKIVHKNQRNVTEPYPYCKNDNGVETVTVSGFSEEEAANAYQKFYIDDLNKKQEPKILQMLCKFFCIERKKKSVEAIGMEQTNRLINFMYNDYKTNMFEKLSRYMDFCSVIYDKNSDSIIAGVTRSINEYTHLYYGYTKEEQGLMISNDLSILGEYCYAIYEMKENTYMKDGEIFTLEGEKIGHAENDSDKEISKNIDNPTDTIKHQEIKDELKNLKEGHETEKSISNEQEKNNPPCGSISPEAIQQMAESIKNDLQDSVLQGREFTKKLDELIDEKIGSYVKQFQVPIVHVIKLNDATLGHTEKGFYHEKFEDIVSSVQLDEPVMLIGPAGGGKNVAVSQVAKALGKHMYYMNAASNEFKLTGFIDAGGKYQATQFYEAFKNGGLFMLDEIDTSDPAALIVINSALANGYMAFPHETIDRHPDFRVVAAANTWGTGADLQYIGRNVLDGATLDRFDYIPFDYDMKLERALYPNEEVLQFMWAFREAVYQCKINHIVSMRGIGKVYKKEINGFPVEKILTSNIVKQLRQDDINTIIGYMQNMQKVDENNKFYEGIKRLELRK